MTKRRTVRSLLPMFLFAAWFWLPQTVLAAPVRQSAPVYALAGVLRTAEDQAFQTDLITTDGRVYGLRGFSAEIETQIQTLLAQGPDLAVKVWGDLYPQGRGYTGPEIIVSDIQPAGTVQPLTATATPTMLSSEPVVIVRIESVNLYGGPSQEHAVVGQMVQGQACVIVGRNEINSWLLVRCSDGIEGWVSSTAVDLQGDLSRISIMVVEPPAPTATATPTSSGVIVIGRFEVVNLHGGPGQEHPVVGQMVHGESCVIVGRNEINSWLLVRCSDGIEGWVTSTVVDLEGDLRRITILVVAPPVPPTPTPTATPMVESSGATVIARIESVNLHGGPGEEHLVVGQMVQAERCLIVGRNEIDSWLLVRCSDGIEGWVSSTVVDLKGDLNRISIIVVAAPVPPTSQVFSGWKASYYANRNLEGEPVLVQDVPAVDFDWGLGSPDPVVPVDNFSARYERVLNFVPDTYRLCTCNLDDGARLFIDGELVLNDWREGAARNVIVERPLSGEHRILIEYFEAGNAASIRFVYADSTGSLGDWQAVYWNNPALEDPAVGTRLEPRSASGFALDYNWGTGSPVPGIVNPDNFSARWEAPFYFEAGNYLFNIVSDDGVHVYMDGVVVVDAWQGGHNEQSSQVYGVSRGRHQMRVEYYESVGDALVRVWWYLDPDVREE